MFLLQRQYLKGFLAVVVATLCGLTMASAAFAQGNTHLTRSVSQTHMASLASCRLLLMPQAFSTQGESCLEEATISVPVLSQSGVSPKAASAGCTGTVGIFQNGPYPPSTGWELCAQGYGTFYVPPAYNDQASSWTSSCDGIFYANQPGTTPNAYFPVVSSGNFPWGGVANDSLSSLYIYPDC